MLKFSLVGHDRVAWKGHQCAIPTLGPGGLARSTLDLCRLGLRNADCLWELFWLPLPLNCVDWGIGCQAIASQHCQAGMSQILTLPRARVAHLLHGKGVV